jgi:hypothetical protein
LTAQWQAALTLQLRPCSMSSKAPLRTDTGAASEGWTVAGAAEAAEKPSWLELVVEALVGEEAELLGDPLVEPDVRLDAERGHVVLPFSHPER